jgi:hypothetical protein
MLTRRAFAACALCAAGGFLAATGAEAETAVTPGLKRTLIKQTDGPADGYVTVETRVDIEPNAVVARHTHPGIESSYLVEGGFDLTVDGEGTRTLAAARDFKCRRECRTVARTGRRSLSSRRPMWSRRASRSPRPPEPPRCRCSSNIFAVGREDMCMPVR